MHSSQKCGFLKEKCNEYICYTMHICVAFLEGAEIEV